MRNITFEIMPDIPSLAWLVEFTDREATFFTGRNVEVFNDGIFEGCWDGDFGAGNFENALIVFGTGVRVSDESVVIVTPTHTLEAVFVVSDGTQVSASNSLAYLLQFHGMELPIRRGYGAAFASLAFGMKATRTEIYRSESLTLVRYAHCNVEFHGGTAKIQAKRAPNNFNIFDDYSQFLTSGLQRIIENGRDADRIFAFEPLTTISSGYDSAACAAIGSKLGLKEAVTLRSDNRNSNDSGSEVAKHLGLNIKEFERPTTVDELNFHEATFISTGLGGEDFIYQVFGPYLPNRLLLTGFHGDKVWGLNEPANTVISRGDVSGCSMTEWRLETGFCLAPIPFMGIVRHPDILAIGQSDEMQPFRVGGDYDRPVPRRIVEDMGVPRAEFGQIKKAASIHFFKSIQFLSESSKTDFYQYRSRVLDIRRMINWAIIGYLHSFLEIICRVVRKLCRLASAKDMENWITSLLIGDWRIFEHSHPFNSDLAFLWAIENRKQRYRNFGPT